jgi:hypothetical protein
LALGIFITGLQHCPRICFLLLVAFEWRLFIFVLASPFRLRASYVTHFRALAAIFYALFFFLTRCHVIQQFIIEVSSIKIRLFSSTFLYDLKIFIPDAKQYFMDIFFGMLNYILGAEFPIFKCSYIYFYAFVNVA